MNKSLAIRQKLCEMSSNLNHYGELGTRRKLVCLNLLIVDRCGGNDKNMNNYVVIQISYTLQNFRKYKNVLRKNSFDH